MPGPQKPFNYVSSAYRDARCSDISDIASTRSEARLAGRVTAIRKHGGLLFCDIQDESGQAQAVFQRESVGEAVFEGVVGRLSRGDIVSIEGTGTCTKRGQASLSARQIRVLAVNQVKNLTPDQDRLDEMLDRPDLRVLLGARSQILNGVRQFLIESGFSEHTTPVLQGKYGGGRAKPFSTHVDAADRDVFLRVTMEMHLKRMVAAGFHSVYEIGKSFRNEGISRYHMPEFTLLEMYQAYQETPGMVAQVTAMVDRVAEKAHYTDLAKMPWRTLTYKDALVHLLGLDLPEDINDADTMKQELVRKGYHPGDMPTAGPMHDHIMYVLLAPRLEGKYVVSELAASTTPLVKRKHPDADVLDRAWIYLNGVAVADIANENTDPVVQCKGYLKQAVDIAQEDRAHDANIDPRLLHAQLYGLPPIVGVGLGIERLVMGITNAQRIRDVIPFPLVLEKDVHTTPAVRKLLSTVKRSPT